MIRAAADAHRLIEQLYDELDKPKLNRDALRDITDSISPIVMAQGELGKSKELLWNGIYLSPKLRLLVELLFKNFGRIVTKDSIYKVVFERDNGDGPDPKIVDVQMCKLRDSLTGSAYGVKTAFGVGYAMVTACEGSPRLGDHKRSAVVWENVKLSPAQHRIVDYLVANRRPVKAEEIREQYFPGKTIHAVRTKLSVLRAKLGKSQWSLVIERGCGAMLIRNSSVATKALNQLAA